MPPSCALTVGCRFNVCAIWQAQESKRQREHEEMLAQVRSVPATWLLFKRFQIVQL
eukprot:SAG31_NODE_1840_length_7122_cov_2.822156_2_plen_56_part_00